jgi:hypothetical protein
MLTSKKLLLTLSLLMGLTVIISNFLVQYPINYYGLQDALTYGALSYPVTFLITDITNRAFGKSLARKVVVLGFSIGITMTLFVSTNFSEIISIRIAIGSGFAFLIAQNLDIQIFDKLRKNKKWYVAPFISSLIGSSIDTLLFFSIAFYGTGVPWVTLSLGDFFIKLLIALTMLIPFRLLLSRVKDLSNKNMSYKIV